MVPGRLAKVVLWSWLVRVSEERGFGIDEYILCRKVPRVMI